MLAPGLYFDPAGYGHIFPDELLAYLSLAHPEAGFDPNSENDYNMVVWEFEQTLHAMCPGMQFKIVKHEREQH
jgi:hypothetical protein